jgi:hypothetical protein
VLELVETIRRRRSWRPAAEGLLLAFGLGEREGSGERSTYEEKAV